MKIKNKINRVDTLWAIWSGDDAGYFLYWSFAPTRKEAIERLALIWPGYPWKKAYADGCRAVKVNISQKDMTVWRGK